ncbi:PilW family protein [Spongiibacter tropicus]|uniref:PilW family protein n=1 Tax=Spongiibacter tropicus TaxID=454602 RepID=UPI000E9E7CE9|nr:PilW family protein [Spongiibacter tropicus]MCH2551718.1 PilW family protein [Alcanivorax sp.]HAR58830.1 hypothetical protein [Alcanivorax sp.]HBM24012.1 hypothetical protein [Alcanivorax sp.]
MIGLSRQDRQTGIGLVEIMVALVVSSLLIGGLIQIFSSNKQAYILQDEMSRLQESGRFAFHFLMKDMRMAGYFGCRNNVPVQNNLDTSDPAYDNAAYDFAGAPLVAYNADGNGGWSPSLPASIQALEPLPGNDIILIRSADAGSVNLTPPYQSGDAQKASIHLEQDHGLQKGDIAVVSDCSRATVVQITGEGGGGTSAAVTNNTGSTTPGNATSELGANYGDGAIIAKIQSTVFYVANNVNNEPALFRKNLTSDENAEELVAGIDQMSLRYGLDSNNNRELNSYVEAPTASQLAEVMAVRVSMLLRGERQNIVDDGQSFVLDGDVISRDDGRLRYVVSSTATVRNRAP